MKHTNEGREFTNIVLEIFKLNGLLITEGDQLTKEFGLSSARWKVLGALVYSDLPLTVPQIAHSMGQTRQSVQRLTDIMEKAGMLLYQNNPRHKKAKLVSLTEKGKEIFKELEKKQIPWSNSNSADIDIQEMKITLSVLKKMVQRFES